MQAPPIQLLLAIAITVVECKVMLQFERWGIAVANANVDTVLLSSNDASVDAVITRNLI